MTRQTRRIEAIEDKLNVGRARTKSLREAYRANEIISKMVGEPAMTFAEFLQKNDEEGRAK